MSIDPTWNRAQVTVEYAAREAEIAALTATVATLNAELATATTTIADLNVQIVGLDAAAASQAFIIAGLDAEIGALEGENDALETSLAKKARIRDALEELISAGIDDDISFIVEVP